MIENKSDKKKILLIEDDKYYLRSLKDCLKRAGFEVAVALTGEEGITKIKADEGRPDLVLLDILLPVKNGFEVLEEVGQDKELKKIPVIILSNLGEKSDIQRGKSLGAVDHWVKIDSPIKTIIEKVSDYLKD